MAPAMRRLFTAAAAATATATALRRCVIAVAVIGNLFLSAEAMISSAPKVPDVLLYFPEVNHDASLVSWAHGVNSIAHLDEAITDNAMMIEADVSFGHVLGDVNNMQAVMAHPPAIFSNVSLAKWIEYFLSYEPRAGIKLDFKSMGILDESLKTLHGFRDKIVTYPLWLNADIQRGPYNASAMPLDAKDFIQKCRHYFPGSVLSLGWTTNVPTTPDTVRPAYSWQQAIAMDNIITENLITQQVTFPVRAVFLKASYQPLKWLSDVGNARTLTVWSSETDPVSASDLLEVRAGFDKRMVYYDLPTKLRDDFWAIKDTAVPTPPSNKPEKLRSGTWITEEGDCARTGSEAIVFRGSCMTVYMDKYQAAADYPITIDGELEFLESEPATSDDSLAIGLRSQNYLWVTVSANGSLNYPAEGYTKDVVPALPASRCFKFRIVDSGGTRPIKVKLTTVTCWPWESVIINEGPSSTFEVDIPASVDSTIQPSFSSKGNGYKVVHSFRIVVPSASSHFQPLAHLIVFVFGLILF